MADKKGVYIATKKDNSIYYRVSITHKSKHISLGSYDDEKTAAKAYAEAKRLIDGKYSITSYRSNMALSHDKFIVLLNFRDNGLYISTPIYLRKNYFEYYLSRKIILKFDRDDLFFYSSHKIQQKGGYLFVSDYGSQYNIQSRYGIKPFAQYERDFIMINGDKHDYRYSNIKIINNFTGVQKQDDISGSIYKVYIHVNGHFLVGTYKSELYAAIAYNKAVDTLHQNGSKKQYIKNYIQDISSEEYHSLYEKIKISNKLIEMSF